MTEQLEAWDFVAIGVYFALVLAVGLWVSVENTRSFILKDDRNNTVIK